MVLGLACRLGSGRVQYGPLAPDKNTMIILDINKNREIFLSLYHLYVVHWASDARSDLFSVFEWADTVEPCCAIAEHGFVEVVCLLVFWNFNEFFKVIIIYHINRFSVKIDVMVIGFRWGELSRRFFIAGQGGPEGTPFNFFASAKKFFCSGGRGVRGVLAVKKFWREEIPDEKKVQNGLQTKRLYRTDEPSVLHGGWGVRFKCKIVFTENAPDPSELDFKAVQAFLHLKYTLV